MRRSERRLADRRFKNRQVQVVLEALDTSDLEVEAAGLVAQIDEGTVSTQAAAIKP